MARQEINQEFNTFVGGILTEANPINYPAGFSLDQENFLLGLNGTNRKRYGLDVDSEQTTGFRVGLTSAKAGVEFLEAFIWPNANNTTGGKQDILCVIQGDQANNYLITDDGEVNNNWLGTSSMPGNFFRWSSTPFKSNLITTSLDLDNLTYSDGSLEQLYVPGAFVSDIDVTLGLYSTVEQRPLYIRDFEGIDDGLVVNERPVVLSDEHHYNLLNQGWTEANIQQFFTDTASYPSNADNMNTGLDDNTGAFTSAWVQNANNGVAKVGGGRNIMSPAYPLLYRRKFLDDNLASGLPVLAGTDDSADAYLADVAEQFGRLFYLWTDYEGVSVGGSSKLLFSPIFSDFKEMGNCYSINDPTARDFNQTLPSDGGYIDVSKMGSVFKIVPFKTRLVIFSDTGIYELFNAQDIPTPSTFNIRKISEVVVAHAIADDFKQAYNPVVAEDVIFFLASSGAYAITANTSQEESIVTNISDKTVQSLIKSYPESSLSFAQGAWSSESRSVHWLLNSSGVAEGTVAGGALKDIELVFNTTLNAWSKNSYIKRLPVGNVDPSLLIPALGNILMVELPPRTAAVTDYPVGSRLRYIGVSDDESRSIGDSDNVSVFKPIQQTYYDFVKDSTFNGDSNGYDYTAFIQTGYINVGDTQRYKQSSYIVPSFLRTEDGFTDDGNGNLTPTNESSCTISAWWDYVDDASQPKANAPFEAYRYNRLYIPEDASDTFDYGQSVLTTKNRLTGRGRALSLRFESGPGKDCRLLGWGMDIETNNRV